MNTMRWTASIGLELLTFQLLFKLIYIAYITKKWRVYV